MWRAEESGRAPHQVGDGSGGIAHLAARSGRGQCAKVAVSPAVVLDLMARLGNALYDACSASGSACYHEERGPHRVLGKQIEDARRPLQVRAVVLFFVQETAYELEL